MFIIKKTFGGHSWEKLNTKRYYSRKGMFDKYQCQNCGIQGKSFSPDTIQIDGRKNLQLINQCSKKNSK